MSTCEADLDGAGVEGVPSLDGMAGRDICLLSVIRVEGSFRPPFSL